MSAALALPLPAPPAKARISLSPEQERLATARLEVIRPLIEWVLYPARRGPYRELPLDSGLLVQSSDDLAQWIAERQTAAGKPMSRASVWNWKARYKKSGLVGLADAVRSDKGQSRFFRKHPEAARLVASVWLKPYATAEQAHENLRREHRLLGIAAEDVPSYETVRAYLATIPKPLTILAREGERAYAERAAPYLAKDYGSVRVNQLWVGDHSVSDVFVRNDCFEGVAEDARLRLRFSAFMDMRSRKFVGYVWAPEGNSRVIATAIRRGVERYGLPEALYIDNGADYKKVAKGAEGAERQWRAAERAAIERTGVLHALGIGVQFCLPYSPQSKNIERAFRTVHGRFDALFPHYTSGTTQGRPDQTVIAMGEHARFLKHGGKSPLMPASLYIRMATVWIEEEYNNRHRHRGQGMDGRTPDEVFAEGWSESATRRADPAILAQLLFERQRRRVRETAVTLHKARYVPADEVSSAQLHLANESDVLICYDPHDRDAAVVCDLNGHHLATVRREILTPHAASAQPAIAASMRERKRLRNATVSTLRQIHHGVATMGHKSDLELLLDRAGREPFQVAEHIAQPLRRTGTDDAPAPRKPTYSYDIAAAFLAGEGE